MPFIWPLPHVGLPNSRPDASGPQVPVGKYLHTLSYYFSIARKPYSCYSIYIYIFFFLLLYLYMYTVIRYLLSSERSMRPGGCPHLQRRIFWDPEPGTLSTSCLASKSTSGLFSNSRCSSSWIPCGKAPRVSSFTGRPPNFSKNSHLRIADVVGEAALGKELVLLIALLSSVHHQLKRNSAVSIALLVNGLQDVAPNQLILLQVHGPAIHAMGSGGIENVHSAPLPS